MYIKAFENFSEENISIEDIELFIFFIMCVRTDSFFYSKFGNLQYYLNNEFYTINDECESLEFKRSANATYITKSISKSSDILYEYLKHNADKIKNLKSFIGDIKKSMKIFPHISEIEDKTIEISDMLGQPIYIINLNHSEIFIKFSNTTTHNNYEIHDSIRSSYRKLNNISPTEISELAFKKVKNETLAKLTIVISGNQ